MGSTFVVFLMLISLVTAHPFKLVNCDAKAPLQVTVSKFPTPFILKNNATFHLSANIELKKSLPENMYVKVSVAKSMGFWMRIPCLGCDFSLNCKTVPELCMFRQMCSKCSLCADNIKVALPPDVEQKIPKFLPDFVMDGDYWVRLKLVDEKTKHIVLACFEIYINIKNN